MDLKATEFYDKYGKLMQNLVKVCLFFLKHSESTLAKYLNSVHTQITAFRKLIRALRSVSEWRKIVKRVQKLKKSPEKALQITSRICVLVYWFCDNLTVLVGS